MKKILIIILLFASFMELNAQVKGLQISTKKEQRSLTMFFGNLSDEVNSSAVFIDGKHASLMELLSINSKFIDSHSVENKIISFKGKEYKEQLYIKTKDGYQSKRISLKDIKKEYAKNQNLPCFYFLDGTIAKVDDVDIFLDENNILEICCHLYENTVENLKLNIIEIFTRSDKNIEQANTMIIRK
jgi:hypothetical protein